MKFLGEAATLEEPKQVISSVLAVRKQLGVIVDALGREPALVFGLKEGFEDVVGRAKQTETAHRLARYVDEVFKSGHKTRNDQEMEETLDLCMHLFRALNAKDVFEAFYRKDMAKRLLLGKSASADLEKAMIQRLRTECGSSFTFKMEGMLKDMDLTEEVCRSFRDGRAADAALEFSARVLTGAAWPSYAPLGDIALPPAVAKLHEEFCAFYVSQHKGRKLQFISTVGQCHLRLCLDKKKWELVLSHCQALVLLLYNGTDTLRFDFAEQSTKIPKKELQGVFFSLVNPRLKLITKQGGEGSTEYVLNKTFTHKHFLIHVASVQAKETQEEVDETKERVFEDRQFQVDAAIVRVMKARSCLQHGLCVLSPRR